MGHVIDLPGHAGNGALGIAALERVKIFAGIFLRPEVGALRLHHGRAEQVAIDAGVKEFGLGPLLRFPHADFFHGDSLADRAVRIVEVAGKNRLRGTDDLAGGFVPHLDAGSVEVALGRRVSIGIDVERVIGTGLHA